MFDNTLIGLQDVPTGITGAKLARRLAGPAARLTLVRVHGGSRIVASSVSHSRANTERGLAEADLTRVSQTTGIADVVAVGAQSTGQGLISAVTERRGDLLVLTATQVFAPSENLLGSLSQQPVPVAIAGYGMREAGAPVRSIGIAYDNSSESDRALTFARRVAGAWGAGLTGLQVRAPQGTGGTLAATRAADEIIAFSATVDLIVMAPRPTRPLRRLLGPGTIEEVLASAAAPVMMVPAQATIPPPLTPPLSEKWVSSALRVAPRRVNR